MRGVELRAGSHLYQPALLARADVGVRFTFEPELPEPELHNGAAEIATPASSCPGPRR